MRLTRHTAGLATNHRKRTPSLIAAKERKKGKKKKMEKMRGWELRRHGALDMTSGQTDDIPTTT